REREPLGMLPPDGFERGPYGRSGRDAVVRHDDRALRDARRLPAAPVQLVPAGDFGQLAPDLGLDEILGDPERADDAGVEDPRTARDRSDRELRLPWRAQLPRDADVQLAVESVRDLGPDWNSAARDAENEHVPPAVTSEERRQPPARIGAIFESHGAAI